MKKNTNILKKCVAVAAVALALVNLVMPRHAEFDVDTETGIAVCVIDDDSEEDGVPLDDPDFI